MPFEQIHETDMKVTFKSAMEYRPKIRKNKITARKSSSFLLIERGEYLYRFKNSDFVASSGSVVFLPKGASYEYEILSGEETVCKQFEFDICTHGSDTPIFHDAFPCIAFQSCPESAEQCFSRIIRAQTEGTSAAFFEICAGICRVISLFLSEEGKERMSFGSERISPAVKFIKENYNRKIYVKELAEICFMSESQLRRLFDEELGESPIQYKNRIQMEVACNLLKNSNRRIEEIAETVGFDSPYDFSRRFKAKYGVSPKKYICGIGD
ncbi:MAG: helix-turn-helix domain-containing protein [Eubacteriales bacterium]